ncbi:MAG: hypothetical protein KAJ42_09950, partial [Gemmatimonadetes bacterium]|nr:hypothetical protein [Gemmatimonadota bacterium]
MNGPHAFRPVLAGLILGLALLLSLASPADAQKGVVLEGQTLHSEALGSEWEYSVYLPPGYDGETRSYHTVYLLHGYGGNHTDWVRLG